ncbi:Crp/Fnr family transcriptional regulator [Hymenobacter volaticus]|uniref:Crp/Fnr family transcriptional regulator n=1 Tax=Hymenobacter volaticus TaxID=2932254 RepID=A0ABY4GER0_9BACT|nr:Crp/Fnr family transcriptional regulator [Hymenobacter volaticus]UOQ69332.1 Crp/Fnr family transcriptional regulator [Hymenobacter volaticus]
MHDSILANVARHIHLTAEEATLFTGLLVPQHIARDGQLLGAGQRALYLTFVVRGCVRTYATDAFDKEHILAFATEGWWCTDSAAFFHRTPATLALQALEATDLLHLSLDHLEQLCQQVPKFERFFRILSQNGFQLLQRRLEAHLKLTAQARFARFHRQSPRLHQRVAQKHIAAYLGVTPEFLSMLRKKKA